MNGRLPEGVSAADIMRIELVAEIAGPHAAPVRTYRVTNKDGSICNVIATFLEEGVKAYCATHDRIDACEGTRRLHLSIDKSNHLAAEVHA